MKKVLFSLMVMFTFIISGSGAWAQTSSAAEEFTLEEITVTAEKREVTLQELPSSVVALAGDDLAQMGKSTTRQILENVPNVKWSEIDAAFGANADGAIAIRGIQHKRSSDGQPPATTGVYVDNIFQGIGGNYDIDRVEILRGPQGTLYGRSSTGGVVSFHTKNPKLSEFSGSVSAEIGEANLINVQAAVNVPINDAFALRASGRFYQRDGYWNPDGDYTENKDGRIKFLYQPTDALEILLSTSIHYGQVNSGGTTMYLETPTKVDHESGVADAVEGGTQKATQASLTVNYDFGPSVLTYIGAYHKYKDNDGVPTMQTSPFTTQAVYRLNPGEDFHTQEIRLASDSEGPLTWLIGVNYYKSTYDRLEYTEQVYCRTEEGGPEDPNEAYKGATIFSQDTSGNVRNIGFFTEETYNVRDNLRVTGGLRYDMNKLNSHNGFNFNFNIDEYNNSLLPNDFEYYGVTDTVDYHNVTYKFRVEYDLTPDNMLYALTATGFQPGDIKQANIFNFGPSGLESITFRTLPFDEEKLTSYEIGSKNQFLGNRLQVNISAFYYDYSNYQFLIDTSGHGSAYARCPSDIEMKGAELTADWLLTMKDRVSLTAGYNKAEIVKYSYIEDLGNMKEYLALSTLPNVPKLTANLSYDHAFFFSNGSILTPLVEFSYTDGMYLINMTQAQVALGQKPYDYQDSYVVTNLNTTWTSPSGMYSATAYLRNAFDEEYKTKVNLGTQNTSSNTVELGDPRAWGLIFSVKF